MIFKETFIKFFHFCIHQKLVVIKWALRKEHLIYMRKNNWACFLLILAVIVIGGFIGSLFPSTWLNYGQAFGLSARLVLDLGILSITFGLTIRITISSILGIAAAIVIYRFI